MPGRPCTREAGALTYPGSALVGGHGDRFRRGVDQLDYLRLLRCFASFDRAALHASVTRRAASYGFHLRWVSSCLFRLRGQIRPPMRGTLRSESPCPTVRGPIQAVSTTQESAMSQGFQRRPEGRIDSASGTSPRLPTSVRRAFARGLGELSTKARSSVPGASLDAPTGATGQRRIRRLEGLRGWTKLTCAYWAA